MAITVVWNFLNERHITFQRVNVKEGRTAAVQSTAAFYPLIVAAGATGFDHAGRSSIVILEPGQILRIDPVSGMIA